MLKFDRGVIERYDQTPARLLRRRHAHQHAEFVRDRLAADAERAAPGRHFEPLRIEVPGRQRPELAIDDAFQPKFYRRVAPACRLVAGGSDRETVTLARLDAHILSKA